MSPILIALDTLSNVFTTCINHQKQATELIVYSATAGGIVTIAW